MKTTPCRASLIWSLCVPLVLPVGLGADPLGSVDQAALEAMMESEGMEAAFAFAFEAGDELTEHAFTAKEGVGANIGEGRRFSRMPRADLTAPGEWASHVPRREGGANATSCISCHNAPIANGAGDVSLNAVIDPLHTGDPARFLERNTLPLFALGVPQRIAEEMSLALYAQRDAVQQAACETGEAEVRLEAKGIGFGILRAARTGDAPCTVVLDTSGIEGVDDDLVVRAFGWKGTHASIRDFTRGAAHNEIGMQAVELVGDLDGDHDGVTHELSVGDMTALTIYMAALERPTSLVELADHGLWELSSEDRARIETGEALFTETGCASCHTPSLPIEVPVFQEPSAVPGFFDAVFPDGSAPAARGLTRAVRFDLTADQPNNRLEGVHLGALPVVNGQARALWYSDFRRHDLGPDLADPEASQGMDAGLWLTRSLAGVGSTGPWLHDGRATTLNEAILAHGGDAGAVRNAYQTLAKADRSAILAFLDNLVIHKVGDDH